MNNTTSPASVIGLKEEASRLRACQTRGCLLFQKMMCLSACVCVCIWCVHRDSHVPHMLLVFCLLSCECCCDKQASWADSIRTLLCPCLQSCYKDAGVTGVCYHVWLFVGSWNLNSSPPHVFRATLFSTDPCPQPSRNHLKDCQGSECSVTERSRLSDHVTCAT